MTKSTWQMTLGQYYNHKCRIAAAEHEITIAEYQENYPLGEIENELAAEWLDMLAAAASEGHIIPKYVLNSMSAARLGYFDRNIAPRDYIRNNYPGYVHPEVKAKMPQSQYKFPAKN